MNRINWWISIFDEAFKSLSDDHSGPDEELTRARAERDAACAHAARWRREAAALVGVQAEGKADSELLLLLRERVEQKPTTEHHCNLPAEMEKVREELRATGHSVTGPLHVDVDRAIDTERSRAQSFLNMVTSAIGVEEEPAPSWPTEAHKVLEWVKRDRRDAENGRAAIRHRGQLLALLSEVFETFHPSPWVREGYVASVEPSEWLDKVLARHARIYGETSDEEGLPF